MPFEIALTTAEEIIGATDAALQVRDGVDDNLVASFLDVPLSNARNALLMAEQLGLIAKKGTRWKAVIPFSEYLVTSVRQYKATILRLVLEQYAPYKYFKNRLAINGIAQEAASQTRAVFSLSAHRADILGVFLSLGTYTNSLVSEGGGLHRANENAAPEYLSLVEDVIMDRASAEQHVRRRIGTEAADWIDQQEVLNHLVTAYQRLNTVQDDPRPPIVHAANAVESLLVQLAAFFTVGIQNATGINSKVDRIAQANHLTAKHKHMLKYLGHVRNAAEHGIDTDIGQMWEISANTSIEYVHVAQSLVTDLVAYVNNRFVI